LQTPPVYQAIPFRIHEVCPFPVAILVATEGRSCQRQVIFCRKHLQPLSRAVFGFCGHPIGLKKQKTEPALSGHSFLGA